MTQKICIEDLENIFDEKASVLIREKFKNLDFSYQQLDRKERDSLFLTIIKTLKDDSVKKSGNHRINDWVAGWGQNRDEFLKTNKYESLIPKYFGKFPYVRWKQDFIKPKNKQFEYNMVKILQYWIFEKYLSDVSNIYEFGCGTGHNLFRASEVNPSASITGLDWATSSQEIFKYINQTFNKNFNSHRFDFFNIDKDYKILKNSGVFTFAALEQVGNCHMEFLEYLIKQSPQICVHIEPIAEMLNPDESFIDFLSVEYFKKRNYLDGLNKSLKTLESNSKIEIVHKQRSQIGSCFVDGYSIIVWRPKNA